VHRRAGPMAERTGRVKREVAVLVALVVLVDGLFIAGYFVAGVVRAPDTTKLVYTGLWTLVTMVVVLRGLLRIRAQRAAPEG
jgi:hypothetical protein